MKIVEAAEVEVETAEPASVEVAEPAEPEVVKTEPLSKEEKKKAELERVKERSKTIDFDILGTAKASEKDDLN